MTSEVFSITFWKMKTVVLGNEKETKRNQQPPVTRPNVTESCMFVDENGKPFWFYLREVPEKLKKIAGLLNKELNSKNVPKDTMNRIWYENWKRYSIKQYSTIVWAVRPDGTKRRYKPWLCHTHLIKSMDTYIKLVYLFAKECEELIKSISPELYQEQLELMKPQEIKIGNLWTSCISNFNSAAKTHTDGVNVKWANNIIYYKRENSTGWNLHLPWYDIVVDSADDSLLFYPAWKSMHGVEEITPTKTWGYRNSLVLYPLDISYDTKSWEESIVGITDDASVSN